MWSVEKLTPLLGGRKLILAAMWVLGAINETIDLGMCYFRHVIAEQMSPLFGRQFICL